MEIPEHGFLEELPAPSFTPGVSEFLPNGINYDSFYNNPTLATLYQSSLGFYTPAEPGFQYPFSDHPYPLNEEFTVPEIDPSHTKNDTPFPAQEEYHYSLVEGSERCLVEVEQTNNVQVFDKGGRGERKTKAKRLQGLPSKNLMAERARRKRLNDRLSMLRSVVPKISKMDKTSTLGDTIDYMKELVERIDKLKVEGIELRPGKVNFLGNVRKELKPNEVKVRNSPKFDIERRESETMVEICCAAKPRLLQSTVNTLESLGLEIQQCVISCFSDFSMQAICSEVDEQKTLISSEDIRLALLRNAGYGGKCL